MLYTQLGNTDLMVSKLGFGLMRLPLNKNNPDFQQSTELIQHAVEKGINFFDIGTFYCHFHCEKAFGVAMNNQLKNKIIWSGKNSLHQYGNLNWKSQLENTLKEFNTDKLDIYFLHYLQYDAWIKYFIQNNIVEELNEAKAKGLFKYLGFSSHDTPENIKKLIDTNLFNAVILQYNLLETKYENTIDYAKQKGLGVIIMNPLSGGILTKSIYFNKGVTDFANIKKAALSFLFENPKIDCVLSGMVNKKEIDQNLSVLEKQLVNKESIDNTIKLLKEFKENTQVLCTNCKYCMPCAQGIEIPSIIKIYNKYSIIHGKTIFSREYSLLDINASSCIECGTCENKCPNQLAIIKIMKESSEKYFQ